MPTIEELKESVIGDEARLILNNLTAYTDNQTHLTLLKSARYHISEYHKELTKAKVGIDAVIQIRHQHNNPQLPGDNKLSGVLQRKCEDISDILNKLDYSISAYERIVYLISEIREKCYVPHRNN